MSDSRVVTKSIFGCLFQEIRKALNMMKDVGVDLERDNQFQKVFWTMSLLFIVLLFIICLLDEKMLKSEGIWILDLYFFNHLVLKKKIPLPNW